MSQHPASAGYRDPGRAGVGDGKKTIDRKSMDDAGSFGGRENKLVEYAALKSDEELGLALSEWWIRSGSDEGFLIQY